jgi:transposase
MRRRLRRVVQRSRDKDYARRALAILQLRESGGNVTEVAERLCAARSSVNRWRGLFAEFGESGIAPQRRGRSDWKASTGVLNRLRELVSTAPAALGYLRSRWSSELLARELARQCGTTVHATTVRRWLRRLAFGYRRARAGLRPQDPHKSRRLRAIRRALADDTPGTALFYVDEVDIHLNPKIGSAWMPRGTQAVVPTPGKNVKTYLAGALHARSGRLVWVEYAQKNSLLFIHLLYHLHRAYRSARRIVLILDNYSIHKSFLTQRWLAQHPKFELLFQPTYYPWVNQIERLWKQLHDTITRNHLCATLPELMRPVRRFLQLCQPFPGSQPGLATA